MFIVSLLFRLGLVMAYMTNSYEILHVFDFIIMCNVLICEVAIQFEIKSRAL
jgi:hypothetical protein